MAILFISDLHLCASRPSVTKRFIDFLNTSAPKYEALFILGDFFEVWLGDDNNDPHDREVINALAKFTQRSLPVYFMQGNRDFLIGKHFAKQTGVTLIPDPYVVELYGDKVLLMHGDSLCTLDVAHQRFRKIVRNPVFQWLFLKLPLFCRQRIAKKLRNKSRQSFIKENAVSITSVNTNGRFEVTQQAVESALIQCQAQILIHGHTHQAGIHEFKLKNKPAKRIVLGEWGPLGNVLVYAKGSLALKNV